MSREFEPHAASLRMTVRMQARWLARIADSPHLHQTTNTTHAVVFLFLQFFSDMRFSTLFGEHDLLLPFG